MVQTLNTLYSLLSIKVFYISLFYELFGRVN